MANMYHKHIVLCVLLTLIVANGELTTREDKKTDLIETNDGEFGNWGPTDQYCDSDYYAIGFRTKAIGDEEDEIGATSFSLVCANKHDRDDRQEITPNNEHELGSWGEALCPGDSFLIGFNQKVSPNQGANDDIGADSVRGICSDTSGTTIEPQPGWSEWGSWAPADVMCPINTAICGQNLKVEQATNTQDNTGLNAVKLYCCKYQSCQVTGYSVVGDTSIEVEIRTDILKPLNFTNYATTDQTTTIMGPHQQKCLTKSSQFTYIHGYKLGLSASWGFESFISVNSVKLQNSIPMTFSAKYDESFENFEATTIDSQQVCQNLPAIEYSCPGRTTCKRSFIVYEAPKISNVTLNIGLICDIAGTVTVTGVLQATGVAAIIAIDSTKPLDCKYYTDNDYDRGDGALPFCDTCTERDSCSRCRDYKVLIQYDGKGQCVDQAVCKKSCNGEIGDGDEFAPYFGGFCDGMDVSADSCVGALKTIFPAMSLTKLQSSNESMFVGIGIGVGICCALCIVFDLVLYCTIFKKNVNAQAYVQANDMGADIHNENQQLTL